MFSSLDHDFRQITIIFVYIVYIDNTEISQYRSFLLYVKYSIINQKYQMAIKH